MLNYYPSVTRPSRPPLSLWDMRKTAIIILIILASVAASSGYFYYRWIQFNNYSPISGTWPNVGMEGEDDSQPKPPLIPEFGQIKSGKIFDSNDGHFQFRYPQDWTLTPLNPKSRANSKEIIELWRLTNYKPGSVKSTNLPQGSVSMDLEILNNSFNQTLSEILPCGGLEAMECREVKINGVPYRRTIIKLPSGAQSISVAAIKNGRIYKITAYPTPGKDEEKAVGEIQMVINTFKFS